MIESSIQLGGRSAGRVLDIDGMLGTLEFVHNTDWATIAAKIVAPGNETQSLGNRIIETPENVEATEVLRDDRSGFIAYVPPGSVKRGEKLVMTGDAGKTLPCTNCHGGDLKGMDPVPGLAGRSPSYLVRQLYDMQHGFRTGEWTAQMKPVVAKLSADEILAIAASLSSRDVEPVPTGDTKK